MSRFKILTQRHRFAPEGEDAVRMLLPVWAIMTPPLLFEHYADRQTLTSAESEKSLPEGAGFFI